MGRVLYVGCMSLVQTVLILVAVARLLQGGSFSIVLGLFLIVYLIGFWLYIIVRAAKGPISREGNPTTSHAHEEDAITDAPSVGSTPAQASRQTHTVMDFKEEDRLDDDDSGWTQGGVTSGRVHLKTGTFSSVPATLEKTETELALITHDVEKGFRAPLSAVRVEYPWFYLGGGMRIIVNGTRYTLSFAPALRDPERGGERVFAKGNRYAVAQERGKQWRDALADFRQGREMDFQEVDRRYAELKGHYDRGTLTAEELDSQLQQLMLQDGEGRWWAKNRESGEWYYHDGSTWIQDTPPGYQPVGPYYRQRVHDLPASDRETTWRTSSGAPAYQHNGLEANSLNIHVVGRRIMATLVDVLAIVIISIIVGGVIGFVIGVVVVSAGGSITGSVESALNMIGLLVYLLVFLLYYIGFEGYTGQTLGKRLCGIKVVRESTGEIPGIWPAITRTLLRVVDGLFFYLVGFIVVLASGKRQRVGDMVAHTLVVRT